MTTIQEGLKEVFSGLGECLLSWGKAWRMFGETYLHEATVNHFIARKIHFEETLLKKELELKTVLVEIAEKRDKIASHAEEIPAFMGRDALSQLARSVEFKKHQKEIEE